MKSVQTYEIVRDTREKPGQGWQFRKSSKCTGMVVRTLKTGDYSLTGLEDVVCVERKGSLSEFVGNLSKQDLPRFERELVRMRDFKRACVVLEFTMAEMLKWPASAGLGRRIKTTGPYVLKLLLQVQARHPHVHFYFAGDDGQAVGLAVLKQAWADFGPTPKT